mgnify:FL=1|jgi:hypothetical protein
MHKVTIDMEEIIIIDNALNNIDSIRERALLLNYTKSDNDSGGWKGYRCLEETHLGNEVIYSVLNKLPTFFKDMDYRCYFHYTLEETDSSNKIHKDSNSDYAGVLYMNPSPQPNSGTLLYDDRANVISSLDNIYNRLVIYPAHIWHSLDNSFGNDINDSRLIFTMFYSFKKKNINSII